jgi:hypothetical protein
MKRLLFLLLLACPTVTSAQELQTLSNGEVADAEDINDNFRLLLTKIESLQSRIEAIEDPPIVYSKSLGSALQSNGLTFAAESKAIAYVERGVNAGRHYWEITARCGPDTMGIQMGVIGANSLPNSLEALNQNGSTESEDEIFITSDGARLFRGFTSDGAEDWGFLSTATNDVFLIALDLNSSSIYFGKNGVWAGDADPVKNLNPSFEGLNGVYNAFIAGTSRECDPNTFVTNFGASDFAYNVPSGYFKGYCPTIDCEIAE